MNSLNNNMNSLNINKEQLEKIMDFGDDLFEWNDEKILELIHKVEETDTEEEEENDFWTYETLKEKVLGNEQTKLVHSINDLLMETNNNKLVIFNDELEEDYDEETDIYEKTEVFNWVSINECWTDLLDYGDDIIFTEYKGQKWLGISCGGCSWSMDYSIKNLIKKLNNLGN